MAVTNTTVGVFEALMVGGLLLAVFLIWRQRRRAVKKGLMSVPEVPGWVPFLGHWWAMRNDAPGFVEDCYRKYGKMFMLRFGTTKIAVLVDPDAVKEFCATPEDVLLPFITIVNEAYLTRAFSSTFDCLGVNAPILHQGIIRPIQQLSLSFNSHFNRLTREYMKGSGGVRDVTAKELVDKIFHAGIFYSMFGFELTHSILEPFETFCSRVKSLQEASFVAHPTLLSWIAGIVCHRSRKAYNRAILPAVRKYMENNGENLSEFIRMAVDNNIESLGGRKLSVVEVCEVVLCCHFTVIENPAALIGQVIRELGQRPDLWKQLRAELADLDTRAVLEHKLLHACFLEGTRLSFAVMALFRGTFPHSTFRGYDLGLAHMLAIPGQMLTEGGAADRKFKNPKEFRPERFLGENPEPTDRYSIFLWGGGKHGCPGKGVALNTAKLFIHNLVQQCDLELVKASEKDNSSGISATGNQLNNFRITPLTK